MDRDESVGSSRVESRICMHASVHSEVFSSLARRVLKQNSIADTMGSFYIVLNAWNVNKTSWFR
jgi:hypothetical protein